MASSHKRAQEAIRRRGDQNCPHHRGQNVIYMCTDCHKLACVTCATSLHRRHELDEISDIIPDVKRKIQCFIASTENDEIPRVQEKIKKVKFDLLKNRQYYKTLISDIKRQSDTIKSELDDMTNGLIKSCRDLEQGNEELLLKQNADLQTLFDEMNAQIRDCKDALQSVNNVKIYDVSNDIPSKYRDILATESSSANFIPGKLDRPRLESLMGELTIIRPKYQTDKTLPNLPSTRPSSWDVVSQFTPLKGYQVVSMCAAPDNQVWASLYNDSQKTFSNKLLLCDAKGNVQQIHDMDVSVWKLCLHPTSGNIWFVSYDDNKVREAISVQTIVRFVKSKKRFAADGEALSICIPGKNNVYIGQIGGVVKYTQKGAVLSRTTGGDTPIVRTPVRIAVCPVSGNLAVVDMDREGDGGKGERHVIILSPTLQLLHQFCGERPVQHTPQKPFYPNDVCYNSNGEVVIADQDNRSVILVNLKGEYLQTLCSESKTLTHAVCVQSNGDVYVSLWKDSVLVLRET